MHYDSWPFLVRRLGFVSNDHFALSRSWNWHRQIDLPSAPWLNSPTSSWFFLPPSPSPPELFFGGHLGCWIPSLVCSGESRTWWDSGEASGRVQFDWADGEGGGKDAVHRGGTPGVRTNEHPDAGDQTLFKRTQSGLEGLNSSHLKWNPSVLKPFYSRVSENTPAVRVLIPLSQHMRIKLHDYYASLLKAECSSWFLCSPVR